MRGEWVSPNLDRDPWPAKKRLGRPRMAMGLYDPWVFPKILGLCPCKKSVCGTLWVWCFVAHKADYGSQV